MNSVPQWVWLIVVVIAIFAIAVLIGGSCTIGDSTISAG